MAKKHPDLEYMDMCYKAEARNRAKSVTVGTVFGGTSEIGMRRADGTYTFCILQPVEVSELIHQLAQNIGCHAALKPRDDFTSWRDWRVSPAEKKHLNGKPPFPSDMAISQDIGKVNFDQEKAELEMDEVAHQQDYKFDKKGGAHDTTFTGEAEHVVATKKTVNK